jgi:hypothetical protein
MYLIIFPVSILTGHAVEQSPSVAQVSTPSYRYALLRAASLPGDSPEALSLDISL